MTGYKVYQGKQIEGAGPLGLVLLSYEALYKALGRAKMAIQNGETAEEADHTARAMEAIIELSSSLDFEKGEDIAVNLGNLYKYMMDRLVAGMCSGKDAHIVEVMGLVETLYAGWRQLDAEQKNKHKTIAMPKQVALQNQQHQTTAQLVGYAA